jgi:hypothetical protein
MHVRDPFLYNAGRGEGVQQLKYKIIFCPHTLSPYLKYDPKPTPYLQFDKNGDEVLWTPDLQNRAIAELFKQQENRIDQLTKTVEKLSFQLRDMALRLRIDPNDTDL